MTAHDLPKPADVSPASVGDLEALALRCEQASGPDSYADYLIHAQVRGWRTPDDLNCFTWCVGENYQYGDPADERHAIYISESDLPNYTQSLDAALRLMPEGWRLAALCEREPWFCRLETLDFASVTWGKGSDWITDVTAGRETTANAATPALAIAAASLRALAQGKSA